MESLTRSSEHLKEALQVTVGNDANGNPVLISKKKLVLLGVKHKGEKKWRLKRV